MTFASTTSGGGSFSGPAFGLREAYDGLSPSKKAQEPTPGPDEGDDGLQGVELKLASISFDQVRSILQAFSFHSVWLTITHRPGGSRCNLLGEDCRRRDLAKEKKKRRSATTY